MDRSGLDPIDWLNAEFLNLKTKNPRYSLRSFSRRLQMSPGRVSELLSRKRRLTIKSGLRIAERLAVTGGRRGEFVELLKSNLLGNKNYLSSENAFRLIQSDQFHLMAEWYHLAILNILKIKSFRSDLAHIAKRLGLTLVEAKAALERLERLKLVELRKGKYVRTSENLSFTEGVPSAAIRLFHAQLLEKAQQSLESDPIELRNFSGSTFVTMASKIKDAATLITKCRRELASSLEDDDGEQVYHLAIQLFPLTTTQKSARKDNR